MALLTASSVVASNDIFSNISISADNTEVNQCVREVNQAAAESLDTATRLYQTGMCYFCIDCNFNEDNGQLFSISETVELNPEVSPGISAEKNYKTAHTLISQAAGLGNYEAYYGLAVLLYVSNLSESRKTEDEIINNETVLVDEADASSKKTELDAQVSFDNVIKDIINKSHKSDYSQQIHRHLLVAAKQGYLPAQFALSEVYSKGIGIDQDAIQAYAWAATAVAQNPPFGSLRRDEIAAVLDNIKLNQAESIAEKYMKNYTNIFDSASVTVMR